MSAMREMIKSIRECYEASHETEALRALEEEISWAERLVRSARLDKLPEGEWRWQLDMLRTLRRELIRPN